MGNIVVPAREPWHGCASNKEGMSRRGVYWLATATALLCNKQPQDLGGVPLQACMLALGRLGASAELSGPGQGTLGCLVSCRSARWLC